jgi:hypothetical protein
MIVRFVGLIVLFVGSLNLFCPSLGGAASSRTTSKYDTGRFALAYAQALAQSQFDTWAAADLGCLTHARAAAGGKSPKLTAEMARRCWDETVRSHTAMLAQQAESGVFNATGRRVGLSLLDDRHRATENWTEYPRRFSCLRPLCWTTRLRSHR